MSVVRVRSSNPWEKQILSYLSDDCTVAAWLIEKIDHMLSYVQSHHGNLYNAERIRWSELYQLELEGVYDTIRNNTPSRNGLYDKMIVHEDTGRVFRIGYSYR